MVIGDVHVPDSPVDILPLPDKRGAWEYFGQDCERFYERNGEHVRFGVRRGVAMLDRFRRIRCEFGTSAVVRTSVLVIGLLCMSVLGLIMFSSLWTALIAAVGLTLGFLLRRPIASGVEYYSLTFRAGLFIYGVVLFLGEHFGLSQEAKLLIITATTVAVFDLQFWSLSDPSVVNTERHAQK
jgi:hypothetical protein